MSKVFLRRTKRSFTRHAGPRKWPQDVAVAAADAVAEEGAVTVAVATEAARACTTIPMGKVSTMEST